MIITHTIPHAGDVIQVGNFNESRLVPYLVRSMSRNHIMERVNTETGEIDTVQCYVNLAEDDYILDALDVAAATHGDAIASPLVNLRNNVSDSPKLLPILSPDEQIERDKKDSFRRSYRRGRHKLRTESSSLVRCIVDGELRDTIDENAPYGQSPSGKQWSVCGCGAARKDVDSIDAKYVDGKGHYTNLYSCGSVWLCPVCAAKICLARAEQIKLIVEGFRAKYPTGRVVLLTYTLQHSIDDLAAKLFNDLKGAIRFANQGYARQQFVKNVGVDGYVRAFENRSNLVNGHHPHAHDLLLITDDSLTDDELLAEIDNAYGSRYRAKLESMGYETNKYTFHMEVTNGSESYLAKMGLDLELTEGQKKKQKTNVGYETYSPFQLLNEYVETGDNRFAKLYADYAVGTFRKRFITFSRGLLDRYNVEDMEDKEIVDDKENVGDSVVSIPLDVWREMVRRQFTATLLDVMEMAQGSTEAVSNWMIEQGLIEWSEQVRPTDPPDLADP